MDLWNDYIVYAINEIAKKDEHYRILKEEMESAEQAYRFIKGKLCKAEAEQLDRYISLCEEMEYRKAQIAYKLGSSERV